jgi:uncharacterized metal-binding protein YceD (DUF177 family)
VHKNTQLPISHPVSVARLPQKGMPVRLNASEKECGALALAHDLQAVESFHADLLVSKWRRDGVRITGTVTCDIVQTCSITLEPLPAHIKSEVDALFVPETSKLARPKIDEDGEMILDADGPDAPETFLGDQLDVGAIAEEFFALAIDPYPRKEGAALELSVQPEEIASDKVSPFARLADFKQKQ